jgi:hypothetical protein
MDNPTHSATPARAIRATAISFATHLFGALTCATCWAIFGPALALVFGSGGTALLATVRPYAPISLVLSGTGLAYSVYQLVTSREAAKALPYRLAATFTGISLIAWAASAIYVTATLVRG